MVSSFSVRHPAMFSVDGKINMKHCILSTQNFERSVIEILHISNLYDRPCISAHFIFVLIVVNESNYTSDFFEVVNSTWDFYLKDPAICCYAMRFFFSYLHNKQVNFSVLSINQKTALGDSLEITKQTSKQTKHFP